MFVTNSLTGGGAERSMNLVSNELVRRSWPVALVPINAGEPDLVSLTCDVFPLNRQWRSGIVQACLAIVKFNRVVRKWQPDVLVLNCDLPELFGALLFRRQILVIVEHANPAWSTRASSGKIVRRFLSYRRIFYVAVSSHLRIWPKGEFPRRVLQNPILASDEIHAKISTDEPLRRLVFMGRLESRQKQPELLLEIAASCDLEVLFIGEGSMKAVLQVEAETRKLKATFAGYTSDPWSLVGSGDLLIVPSTFEGDGLVVVEGLRYKVPLLIADIPDFRRFGFPDRNYCRDVNSFSERIHEFRSRLAMLIPPDDISKEILDSRSPIAVGNSWEAFLNSL